MVVQKTFFPTESKQKIGAVTYVVAAHFHEEQNDLKEKIKQLLCTSMSKNTNCTFANSRGGDVK